MKIAVCEFNPTVGALKQNADAIIRIYEEIATSQPEIELVVFPEMAICGYPIEDLALQTAFVHAVNVENTRVTHHVLDRASGPALIVGSICPAAFLARTPAIASNIALISEPGETVPRVIKHEMANYGVFDEKRTFIAGAAANQRVFRVKDKRVGVLICEDGWHDTVPTSIYNEQSDPTTLEAIIWINASPFEFGKGAVRRKVAIKHFARFNRPVIYANMCGGQDELVFDGDSFMLTSASLEEWIPACTIGTPFVPNRVVTFDTEITCMAGLLPLDHSSSIYEAIVLGLRDYMAKQGFSRAVLGMSGGVDSALVAAIACDAIGPKNVDLIGLPSLISSAGSVIDAEEAASRLGASFCEMPIATSVEGIHSCYSNRGTYVGDPKGIPIGIAAENIQARVRGLLLMTVSNQEDSLLLTTGNKSEVSVGYSTLYGDMAGGFNPIKDCYKTTVFEMCRWRNQLTEHGIRSCNFLGEPGEVVPSQIISKPPSAELSEGQRDDQSLPPYDVLDPILKAMIEDHLSNDEIVTKLCANEPQEEEFENCGMIPVGRTYIVRSMVQKVRMLVDRAEYKRRQAAPGIKITSKLHGRDRRVPITNHWHG